MSNNEKQALETKQEIKESVKRYKDLYKEANGFVDEKYADLLKNAKNDLAKILDVAEKNKVFSSDVFKSLRSLFNDVATDSQSLDAINKFENFADDISVDVSLETALEFFEKAKSELNNFTNAYKTKGFSKKFFNNLVNILNLYSQSRSKEAKLLYDELKVPVNGLGGLYKNNKLTDVVVYGCLEDINNVLDKYIRDFKNRISSNKTGQDWINQVVSDIFKRNQ